MTIPLLWEYQIRGAEQVKASLKDINQQFKDGKITAEQHAIGVRHASTEMAKLARVSNLATNEFRAMHPQITQLSRAMSGIRGITSAINQSLQLYQLTQLVSMGRTEQQIKNEVDLRRARRASQEALNSYGSSSWQYLDAVDELNIATARQAEEQRQAADAQFSAAIGMVSSVTLIASSIIQAIPKFVSLITTLNLATAAQTALNVAVLANPYVLFAAALIAAGLAVLSLFTAMNELVGGNQFQWVHDHLSFLNPLIDGFKFVLDGAATGVIALATSLNPLVTTLTGFVGLGLGSLVETLQAIASIVTSGISAGFKDALVALKNIITVSKISSKIVETLNSIAKFFQVSPKTALEGALGFLKDALLTPVSSALGNAVNAIKQFFVVTPAKGIESIMESLKKLFGTTPSTGIENILASISSFLTKSVGVGLATVIDGLQKLFAGTGTSTFISDLMTNLLKVLTTSPSSSIITFITNLATALSSIGSDAVKTLSSLVQILSAPVNTFLANFMFNLKEAFTATVTTVINAINALLSLLNFGGNNKINVGLQSGNISPSISNTNTPYGSTTIIIQGSVITERELFGKIDEYFKAKLTGKGF